MRRTKVSTCAQILKDEWCYRKQKFRPHDRTHDFACEIVCFIRKLLSHNRRSTAGRIFMVIKDIRSFIDEDACWRHLKESGRRLALKQAQLTYIFTYLSACYRDSKQKISQQYIETRAGSSLSRTSIQFSEGLESIPCKKNRSLA